LAFPLQPVALENSDEGVETVLNGRHRATDVLLWLAWIWAPTLTLSAWTEPPTVPDAPTGSRSALLVRGATIVDGTGDLPRRGDIRVSGDRIVDIGNLRARPGETVIDAAGKIAAPGFIDIHNHSQEGLDEDPLAESQISQGITTVVIGPDGSSPWPIGEYLRRMDAKPAAPNLAVLVGHGTVRRRVMGEDYRRQARSDEIRSMVSMVDQAMLEGAFGLSSGLEYDPGFYSATDEVVALAAAAGRHRGFYMSHIRDESDKALEALREFIEICRRARTPGQISHIKLGTVGVWGKTADAISLVEEARKHGADITADCYPYTAWSSGLSVLVPSRKFDDPELVRRGISDVGGADRVTITRCSAFPAYESRNLQQIGDTEQSDPVAIFVKIMKSGGASVVCRSMTDEDVRAFYRTPWVMVASDGGIGMRHPRGAGTFPKVLGAFARDEKVISLQDAVRKCTSQPARRLKLRDRGFLRKGMKADIVLFDSAKVRDRATFADPFALSEGIDRVLVNGTQVWESGRATGARAGEVLRRPR
jgi:N-acyl-D-amino-acid deacylase